MKLPALILCVTLAAAEEKQPTPALVEQTPQLSSEEQAATREAVKQVMLARTMRLKEEDARLTAENMTEGLALAEKLHAPQPFVRLLQSEASGALTASKRHELRRELQSTVAAYGVDVLQMRLFVEWMPFPAKEVRATLEWLPKADLFNLVAKETRLDVLEEQLTVLCGVVHRMNEVYECVTNREQADAAAEKLTELLHEFESTAPVRMALLDASSRQLEASHRRIVGAEADRLAELRRRLRETGYFNSPRLAALDYLLS